ncbi:MAG: hypothetical protein H6858_03675 [Rhodospirillales bacterium]|nr:hypothetical protein [Alphaproteobacteria bacterium]MCB1840099.1 hypothetical protein [Alphaproteobacteria bacterium]MCB9976684.1 hypothetical protein [Rhodospirillales bacterium]
MISLHDDLFPYIQPGDRLVYLGNYFGFGHHAVEVVDELLTFRRMVLAKRGMLSDDIVYLRGAQEEMLQKLLQLQFAPDPGNILLWMLGNGLMSTLYSYGVSPHDGIESCRQGVIGLAQWTGSIREAIRKHPGHEIFNTRLHRAAHTSPGLTHPILFVNCGLRYDRPMEEQGDSFWWANREFEQIEQPYEPFSKIIRGYDPDHKGIKTNCVTATIDGGCGFGGSLVCSVFDQSGEALDTAEF